MKLLTRVIQSFLVGIVLLATVPTFASYDNFVKNLKLMNITVDDILTQPTIPRFELARLLNATDCSDCTAPSDSYISRYTKQFWQTFATLPGNDFRDIGYQAAEYNNKSYYYCVAYVGDKQYMSGYPINSSPFCAGQFCGAANTTKAEFLQVVLNVISPYIAPHYATNRVAIQSRKNSLPTDSYAKRTLNASMIQTIDQSVQTCNVSSCPLSWADQVTAYLRYCMFNLDACHMQPMGSIGQGTRPVAELNMLVSEKLLDLGEAVKTDIGKPVKGSEAVQTFSKVNDIIGCAFNADYDCDGVTNAKDNCPTTYNPSQLDSDSDGIGDVCDTDIDNDGVKNPAGIVDDSDRIVLSAYQTGMDNCLFVKNTDQKDVNKNSIGDDCEAELGINSNLGGNAETNFGHTSLYIRSQGVTDLAPASVAFVAEPFGPATQVTRDFGDGTTAVGTGVSHTFTDPGMYLIQATAIGTKNNATASTTVVVGKNPNITPNLSLSTTTAAPNRATFRIVTESKNITNVEWTINSGVSNWPVTSPITALLDDGQTTIKAKAYTNGTLVAIAETRVYRTLEGIISTTLSLPTTAVIHKSVTLSSSINGFSRDLIASVSRKIGNVVTSSRNLSFSTSFGTAGSQVVEETITLTDGRVLFNRATILVTDPSNKAFSFGMALGFQKKIAVVNSPIAIAASLNYPNPENLSIAHVLRTTSDQENIPINTLLNKALSHIYTEPRLYQPRVVVTYGACQTAQAHASIYVQGYDLCLAAKINGTLSQYKCDMDKDGIPDICDDDIDGDGVKNQIGILKGENKDCSITPDIINGDIFDKHHQHSCSLDNCPFGVNPDQLDSKGDGYGDVCRGDEALQAATNQKTTNTAYNTVLPDADHDGIPDAVDACPSIPENYNGIDDSDGCPEINQAARCGVCGNGVLEPGETCQTCPADAGSCTPKCPANTKLCSDGTCSEYCSVEKSCNNNNICEPGESCSCGDCLHQNSECQAGLTCQTNTQTQNNVCAPVVVPKCPNNTKLCSDYTCREYCDTTTTDLTCNHNNVCDANESCSCSDCQGSNNTCQTGLTCATNPATNNPVCLDCSNGKCATVTGSVVAQTWATVITPLNCNQCPCQFADFAGAMQAGEQVRAILFDPREQYRYSTSPSLAIPANPFK